MNIRHIEPFAWRYIHAGRENKDYRIANGMKVFTEELDVSIDPEIWFQSPLGAFGNQAVKYARADGIELNERIKNRNAEPLTELPELEELNFYFDYFRPYETLRIISKVRTPLQEKLEINKCCWAAGGGHSNPDYEMFLRVGTNGIREKIARFRKIHNDREDFYDARE